MTVVEDASTPAVARSATGFTTSTIVTASFSPPANSLLLVFCGIGQASSYTTVPTLTPTATGVTFTQLALGNGGRNKFCYNATFYAYLSSAPGAITVTMTRSGTLTAAGGQLSVRVLTGTGTIPNSLINSVNTGGTEPTDAATTALAGSELYVMSQVDGSCTYTVDSGTTTSLDVWADATDDVAIGFGKSTSLTADTSSHTYGWTNNRSLTGNDSFIQIVEAPAGAAPAGNPKGPRAVTRVSQIRASNF